MPLPAQEVIVEEKQFPFTYSETYVLVMCIRHEMGSDDTSIVLLHNGQIIRAPLSFDVQAKNVDGTWSSITATRNGTTFWVKNNNVVRMNLRGVTLFEVPHERPEDS